MTSDEFRAQHERLHAENANATTTATPTRDETPNEPSPEVVLMFEESIDNATLDVMRAFEWMGLPDTPDERGALMVEINDALSAVLKPWL